jgi:hypothetical protein
MNIKYYLSSTLLFLVLTLAGFFTGFKIAYDSLFSTVTDSYGEEALGFLPYGVAYSLTGFVVGLTISLIIIHKLSKRWGSQLNFGSHPVLKLTSLSFLTFLVLLFLLLIFYPSK